MYDLKELYTDEWARIVCKYGISQEDVSTLVKTLGAYVSASARKG